MASKYLLVGLTEERLNVKHTESRVAQWLAEGDLIDHNTRMRKGMAVSTGMFLVLEYFFLDDLETAYRWMPKLLDYAEEYFFGGWRDQVASGNYRELPPDRAYSFSRKTSIKTVQNERGLESPLSY